MLNGLLVSLLILVCIALVAVVLLQRSEGGALGAGGGPTGLITTRGAGDLLTRTTWILFAMFLSLSLALTLIGGREHSNRAILNGLKNQSINPDQAPTPPAAPFAPGGATPAPGAAAPVNPAAAAVAPPSAAASPQTISVAPPPTAQGAALKPPIPLVRSATPHPAPAARPAAPAAAAPVVISAPPPAPHVEHAPAPIVVPPAPAPKTDSEAPVKTNTP